MKEYTRVYADIDLDAVEYNIVSLMANTAKGTKAMAVVKADAYGHGDLEVAKAVYSHVYGYAVATAEEAFRLRRSGIDKAILVLGYVHPAHFSEIIEQQIAVPLFDMESAQAYSDAAMILGTKGLAHIKIDTGMRRIGIEPDDSGIRMIADICRLPGIEAEGIFTHFATADEADKTGAMKQFETFCMVVEKLKRMGISFTVRHCANSAAVIDLQKANLDMVRLGISMYGLRPSEYVKDEVLHLKPVLSLKSYVMMVKTVPAGERVSYGGTFETGRETVIATIGIGYGDGYPRALSNKGFVLIHGRRVPIIGRICMDQMMIDVTDVPEVRRGDVVTLVGNDGAECITVEALSALTERFNYEFVCDLGKRIPRRYIKNGECIAVRDYF